MTRMESIEFGEDAELYAAYLELMRPFERLARPPTPKLNLDDPETLTSFEILDAEYWAAAEARETIVIVDDQSSPVKPSPSVMPSTSSEANTSQVGDSSKESEETLWENQKESSNDEDDGDDEKAKTKITPSHSQAAFSRFFGSTSQVQSQANPSQQQPRRFQLTENAKQTGNHLFVKTAEKAASKLLRITFSRSTHMTN